MIYFGSSVKNRQISHTEKPANLYENKDSRLDVNYVITEWKSAKTWRSMFRMVNFSSFVEEYEYHKGPSI